MRLIFIILISSLFSINISFGVTFYIDPVNGSSLNDGSFDKPWKTLEEVLNAGLVESYSYSPLPYNEQNSQLVIKNKDAPISSGDILMLRSGLHGELFARGYYNLSNIVIMAEAGHHPILRNVRLQACKNWKIVGVDISREPYGYEGKNKLLFVESHSFHGPSSQIEIEKCNIYGAEQPWQTAAEWKMFVEDGIYLNGNSINVTGNRITNTSMALTAFGDFIEAIGNEVVNFSGDGIRVLGSNILIKQNLIKNSYAIDENHDDGIQSFTNGGLVVDNNIIESNIIINNEDPNQNLLGDLQGIGCFDGFFNNWIVRNNLVYVNNFHGITFLGANNCEIVNNTVLDPTPGSAIGPSRITIADHKDGRPSTGCTVKNNVTNQLLVDAVNSNNVVLENETDYNENFVNYLERDFRLKEGSVLIDAADDNYAPEFDIAGVTRPQGSHADIGCYEYISDDINPLINLANFTPICDKPDIDVSKDPVEDIYEISGMTICGSDEKLIVSIQQSGVIRVFNTHEYSDNVPSIGSIGSRDYEGITYLFEDAGAHFYAACSEDESKVSVFSINQTGDNFVLNENINNGQSKFLEVRNSGQIIPNDPNNNKGLEGITYNPVNGKIYFTKESRPPGLFETQKAYFTANDLKNESEFSVDKISTELDNVAGIDFSGLFHFNLSAKSINQNLIFLLSEQLQTVYLLDLNNQPATREEFLKLPGTHSNAQLEGVVFKNNTLFVCNDDDENDDNPRGLTYSDFYSYINQDIGGVLGVLGDVNCDGKTTIADALLITRSAVNLSVIADCLSLGDVNLDGKVGVADALLITQCEVRLKNSFCPCK